MKQTLASISAQTFSDFEVIVGNDYLEEPLSGADLGITDKRIRFVNHVQNLGELQNNNILLSLAKGRYFTWQTQDDLYTPNFLQEVHTALTTFNHPLCVFTSYELVRGAFRPEITGTPVGQRENLSGREFLRLYWSGKIKALGCTGVYEREYLTHLGGVETLSETSFALYSEHLLLIRVGLLEQVGYIDAPLVKYRIHDDSWGCTNTELWPRKQASENLVRESIIVFGDSELRDDFRQNLTALLRFVVRDFFDLTRAQGGFLSRLKAVRYFMSLRRQFQSLKGSALYWIALFSWSCAGGSLLWWLGTKFDFWAASSSWITRFMQILQVPFTRHD